MKTIAFDALPVELTLLREGYLSALLDQKNWFWGYDTIQIAYDHVLLWKEIRPIYRPGLQHHHEKQRGCHDPGLGYE